MGTVSIRVVVYDLRVFICVSVCIYVYVECKKHFVYRCIVNDLHFLQFANIYDNFNMYRLVNFQS